MAWTWQFETADGTLVPSRGVPRETFASQGDAESWLGENWRELLAGGVDQVTLLEESRVEYGPMSLHAGGLPRRARLGRPGAHGAGRYGPAPGCCRRALGQGRVAPDRVPEHVVDAPEHLWRRAGPPRP